MDWADGLMKNIYIFSTQINQAFLAINLPIHYQMFTNYAESTTFDGVWAA